MSRVDEPCQGNEGRSTPYGREDTWPQFDVTWGDGALIWPNAIRDLCDGDQQAWGREIAYIRRLS